MKNGAIHVSIVCSFVILIVSTACIAFLVPFAKAEETNEQNFFRDWDVVQTHETVHIDIIPPISRPEYNPFNPTDKGSYTGVCPIGMGGAPQLRDTGMENSHALCRGACGPDCPSGRCTQTSNIIIRVEGGTCTYTDVIACPTHQSCRIHDAGYDYCAEVEGEQGQGICHQVYNWQCFKDYDVATCRKWMDLPNVLGFGDWATKLMDAINPPLYEKDAEGNVRTLLFSNEPVFSPWETPPSGPNTTITTPTTTTPITTTPTTRPTTTVTINSDLTAMCSTTGTWKNTFSGMGAVMWVHDIPDGKWYYDVELVLNQTPSRTNNYDTITGTWTQTLRKSPMEDPEFNVFLNKPAPPNAITGKVSGVTIQFKIGDKLQFDGTCTRDLMGGTIKELPGTAETQSCTKTSDGKELCGVDALITGWEGKVENLHKV